MDISDADGYRGGMSKNRRTAETQERFLEAVARGSSVVEGAEYAGVARSTVYAWAARDAEFAERWAGAYRESAEALERRAHELALGGNVRLLIFLIGRADRRVAAAAGTEVEESVGELVIKGLEDGCEFIEFVEAGGAGSPGAA